MEYGDFEDIKLELCGGLQKNSIHKTVAIFTSKQWYFLSFPLTQADTRFLGNIRIKTNFSSFLSSGD